MQIILNLCKCLILTVICGKGFHNLTWLCVKKIDYPSLCKEFYCFVYFEFASSALFFFSSSLAVLLFLNKSISCLTFWLNWCFNILIFLLSAQRALGWVCCTSPTKQSPPLQAVAELALSNTKRSAYNTYTRSAFSG